jgi:hypothetical protein
MRWLSHGRFAHDGNLHKISSSGVTQVSHQPVADRHVGPLLDMTMPRHTGEHRGIAGTILTATPAAPEDERQEFVKVPVAPACGT